MFRFARQMTELLPQLWTDYLFGQRKAPLPVIILDNEIFDENSLWNKEQLLKVIKPEMEELYKYFKIGKKFFKYGKNQRMLESTYLITDSMKNLKNTNLGKEILKLQDIYNKI